MPHGSGNTDKLDHNGKNRVLFTLHPNNYNVISGFPLFMNLISLIIVNIFYCVEKISCLQNGTQWTEHFQGHCTRVKYLTCGVSDAYLCLVQ